MSSYPVALVAGEAPERARKSIYPGSLADRIGDRIKRPLGDLFGLTIFGVNLTTLKPVVHRVTNDEGVPPTFCRICRQRHGYGDRN